MSSTYGFEPVREALDELTRTEAVRRLFERDASMWSDDPGVQGEIADRLGWLDVAGGQSQWSDRLRTFAAEVRDAGIDHIVLAGMGGSSLAPEVFATMFNDVSRTRLTVLDSTHPRTVAERLPEGKLDSTLIVVSSKSGTTAETLAFALRAERLVPSTRHLAAITDPDSTLAQEATARAWRTVFENPPDIGGRYSALSLFGMVPAALIGVDIDAIWRSGAAMADACGPRTGADNPALALAAFMGGLARTGRDKLTLLTSHSLDSFADWIEQLVAESTGKQGTGIVPVVREPVGPPAVYGDDRAFVVIEHTRDPVAGVDELEEAELPVLRIRIDDRFALGGEFVRWEVATALAGALLGIDPFDQPNVAESKQNTDAVLAEVAGGTSLPEPEHGDVAHLLGQVQAGDYVSIQAYLPPDDKIAGGLTEVRLLIRDALRVATTSGWGPRFLHSTGQLHKGGSNSVVALQLVDVPSDEEDVEIPGRDSTFATLVRAQAIGDLRSLRAHDRRVIQRRVDGPEDIVRLIGDLKAVLHKPTVGRDPI
jgi:transaldolase / glucose-6-phosphate isomerase